MSDAPMDSSPARSDGGLADAGGERYWTHWQCGCGAFVRIGTTHQCTYQPTTTRARIGEFSVPNHHFAEIRGRVAASPSQPERAENYDWQPRPYGIGSSAAAHNYHDRRVNAANVWPSGWPTDSADSGNGRDEHGYGGLGVHPAPRVRGSVFGPKGTEWRLWPPPLNLAVVRSFGVALRSACERAGRRGAGVVRKGWVDAVEHARGLWAGVKS